MAQTGAVNIRLGAQTDQFEAAMRSASAALNRLNGVMAQAQQQAQRTSQSFASQAAQMGASMQSVGAKMTAAITAPLALMGTAAFKTYGDIQALQMGLENIEGSAEGAKKRFAELREVAKLPGLGLEEAVKGDVRLRAIGFSANQTKAILLQFGNALALTGGGKFEMDSVITQLSQMGSKSRVLAEDLKPILTASPAVAKAIKDMFGTVDSEQISKQLQAAGKGPADFINMLVERLSALPRVQGGAKNALENLGDSAKIAAFDFFTAADKAFGLTEKLTALGDFISGLSAKFSELPQPVQKVILAVTAAAAAAGPLILAVGTFMTLLPTLKTGLLAVRTAFIATTGPVGLIAAAVAAAAVLIIANWDSIKKVLVESGVWTTVVTLAQSAMELVRAAFTKTVQWAKEVWEKIGPAVKAATDNIVVIVRGLWDTVAAIFNAAGGMLSGIMQVISGILTGNWSKAVDGIVLFAKSLWDNVINIFVAGTKAAGTVFANFLEGVGLDSFAGAVRTSMDAAINKADKLRMSVAAVNKETGAAANNPVAAAMTPKPSVEGKPAQGAADTSSYEAQLKDTTSLLGIYKQRLDDLNKQIEVYVAAKQPVPQALLDLKSGYQKAIDGINAKLKELEDKTNQVSAIQPLKSKAKPVSEAMTEVFASGAGSAVPPSIAGLTDALKKMSDSIAPVKDKVKKDMDEMAQAVADTLGQAANNAVIGGAELLGNLMSGAAGIEALPQFILGVLGDAAVQLGKLAIGIGFSVEAVKEALTSLGGVGAIAAGIALIAIGTAAKNGAANIGKNMQAKRMASGGIAYGKTFAMVGEYAGASDKKRGELVAPLGTFIPMLQDAVKQVIEPPTVNQPSRSMFVSNPLSNGVDVNIRGELVARGNNLVTTLDRSVRARTDKQGKRS